MNHRERKRWRRAMACAAFAIAALAVATRGGDPIVEDEPNCGLNELGEPDDRANGGCNAPAPAFIPLAHQDYFVGTLASIGESGSRDTDWFSIELTEPSRVLIHIGGEVPLTRGIVETGGAPSCDGIHCFRHFKTNSCSGPVTGYVPPGTWWLVVVPAPGVTVACGAEYSVSLSIRPAGDITNNGVVNAADLAILLKDWSTPPGTPACGGEELCPADINQDGVVDASDLAILLGTWG